MIDAGRSGGDARSKPQLIAKLGSKWGLASLPDLHCTLCHYILDPRNAEFQLSPERCVAVEKLHLLRRGLTRFMIVSHSIPIPESRTPSVRLSREGRSVDRSAKVVDMEGLRGCLWGVGTTASRGEGAPGRSIVRSML